MEERKPDFPAELIPEPNVADETDDALFDSQRDQLTQLDWYRRFQGRESLDGQE